MKTQRFDLIGIGECMVELRGDVALGLATSLNCGYGGDVLNALVAASRMGGRSGFVTRVGADPFGASLLRKWQAEGVDLAHAKLIQGENGVYFISLSAGGERDFTYRRHGSAASTMVPEDLDEGYIASAACLLVSGITQAISATAQATTLAACAVAKRHGVRVAFDPNYRERLWAGRGGLRAASAAMHEILPYVDLMLPSYPSDAALLLRPCDSAASAAAQFNDLGVELAQKCGAQGSGLMLDGSYVEVAPALASRVLDTTGAGDTWNGVYLLQRMNGVAALVAAVTANQAAAEKLAHRGAIPEALVSTI